MWKIVKIVGTLVLMGASGFVTYVTAIIILMELGTKFHGNYEHYGSYWAVILLYGLAALGFLAPGAVVWYLQHKERPLQFSLRALFVATTAIAVVLVIVVSFFSWLWS